MSADETGWRVGALAFWLWVWATTDTTVYAIRPGRSFDDATTMLGPSFNGVLVRDRWAPYRHFTEAMHRSCVAHLLRRARLLQIDHSRSPGPARSSRSSATAWRCGTARAPGPSRRMGSPSPAAPARTSGPDHQEVPDLAAAQRFAAHHANEFTAVFAFLWVPDVVATNWRAEHAIRPAVVRRKVCGGNRTTRGAHAQEILASVVRTARQRGLDLDDVLTTFLQPREPTVPEPFRPRVH